MKILLVSNDLMPFGNLPTSGGGLRCWQIMKGLESRGIEVVASMPGFTYLAEKHFSDIPEAQRELLWRWETQEEILTRTKPDAVIFASNWDHYGLSKKPDIPLIIDLHGSRLIETTMWNEPVDTDRKVSVLAQADCLLCAGLKQRSYFYGWLVQAGRVPEDEHFIRQIPISLSPDIPAHYCPEKEDTNSPLFVSGGGWFPWQNQSTAIFAICDEITKRDRGAIEIFGTPHDIQPTSAEELKIRDIFARVKRLSDNSERINVHGYIGRDLLLDIYSRASVAVEAMTYNLERELAFTTRTIEYLWCGLPVLYNNFSEVGEHIRDYDAGWIVDPASETEVRRAIEEIYQSPDIVRQKSLNAQQLVKDRFSWDKTIQPLVDFLENPVRASKVEPTLGAVCPSASFLSPNSTAVDVELTSDGPTLRQEVVIPAENIRSIEIPVTKASDTETGALEALEIQIRRLGGPIVAKSRVGEGQFGPSRNAVLRFPWYYLPRGGAEYQLELRVIAKQGSSQRAAVLVRGMLEANYPYRPSLRSSESNRFIGLSLLGEETSVEALAVSFVPGTAGVYRVRALFERTIWMIKTGQWKRLVRAVIYKAPGLVARARARAFG